MREHQRVGMSRKIVTQRASQTTSLHRVRAPPGRKVKDVRFSDVENTRALYNIVYSYQSTSIGSYYNCIISTIIQCKSVMQTLSV